MRTIVAFAASVCVLAISAPGLAQSKPARTFSVPQAKTAFRAASGLRLVNFRAASTPDAISLQTSPARTRRFGSFQLFVLNPRKLERMRRVFTHGVRPDRRGIHWVPDRAGGRIAVTLFARNLLVAWFPPQGAIDADQSWARLDRVMLRVAPRVTP
jgi:hypothetical protein